MFAAFDIGDVASGETTEFREGSLRPTGMWEGSATHGAVAEDQPREKRKSLIFFARIPRVDGIPAFSYCVIVGSFLFRALDAVHAGYSSGV